MRREAASATLPAVGLFLLALRLMAIIRRVMPVAAFCSIMKVRSKILVLLLIVAYLASGLAIPNAQLVCAVLFLVSFVFTITIYRSSYQSNDEAPRLFPFLAARASRAPPIL